MHHLDLTRTAEWELKIRAKYEDLSNAERKVADALLANPDQILDCGISELAEMSGVSEPSVVRFCRSVGYQGIKDLKISIAKEHMTRTQSVAEDRSIRERDDMAAIKQKVFYGCMEALQDTMDSLDDEALARAVDALAGSSYVEVLGIGGSAVVARCVQHNFRKIGMRVSVCSDYNEHYLLAERFNRGDVVLAISHSGETTMIVDAMVAARRKGATAICITSTRDSALRRAADICLCSISCAQMMPGDNTLERAAQMGIVDALFGGVAMRLRTWEREEKERAFLRETQ